MFSEDHPRITYILVFFSVFSRNLISYYSTFLLGTISKQSITLYAKEVLSKDRTSFVAFTSELHGQGVVDGAECVADLGSEQTHNSDNNDGDERKNDRVLDEALTFFLGCK
jgi:hypothetical protein